MRSSRRDGLDWWLIGAFWVLLGAILVGKCLLQAGTEPLLGDTDDAMRMVTATDLLHGQAWQDLIQHRSNTPFGGSLHWSRLVDAPLALLMALAGPIAGAAAAPKFAAIAWPILLLLPLLVLAVAVTRALVPKAGAMTPLALTALNVVLMVEFTPGRVDHHSVQILLTRATLLVLLTLRKRALGGALAGLLAATSLAIGLETLVLAAAVAYALCWVADPEPHRRALVGFAAGLAACTLGHFLLATPPSLYFVAACDALSIVYLAAIAAGALALALAASFASGLAPGWRLAVLAVLGAIAAASAGMLFPGCLGGPYAGVDKRVLDGMFHMIAEAQPLFQHGLASPSGIVFGGSALLAIPLTAWRAFTLRGDRRADWLIVFGLLTVAASVMLVEVRGARLAAALALPAGAWLIASAREAYLQRRTLWRAGAHVGSWVLFATLAQYCIFSVGLALLAPTETNAAPGARGPRPA